MNQDYNVDIPNAPNDPSVDQPKMKVNTNSISNLIAQDHFGFKNNFGGYHKTIHQIASSAPNTIQNVGQIYNKSVTVSGITTTQLFYKSGPASMISGAESQLTGHKAALNGYQWVGGVLLQWGVITLGSGLQNLTTAQTENLNISYLSGIWDIQFSLSTNNPGSALSNVNNVYWIPPVSPAASSSFQWVSKCHDSNGAPATSTNVTAINWFAIGS